MKTITVEIVVRDNDVGWCKKRVWNAADEFVLPVFSVGDRNSTEDEIQWAKTEAGLTD